MYEKNWKDYRGTSSKTDLVGRGSKYNPYVCDHCGYRTGRFNNMVRHLENMHGDNYTDPRIKSHAIKEGIKKILQQWKAH